MLQPGHQLVLIVGGILLLLHVPLLHVLIEFAIGQAVEFFHPRPVFIKVNPLALARRVIHE